MLKFKKRYVLGVGYPDNWPDHIMLYTSKKGSREVELKCPKALECTHGMKGLPRYRLVLERVEADTD